MHAQYTLLMTLVALSSLVLVLMLIAIPVRYMRDYHRRVISGLQAFGLITADFAGMLVGLASAFVIRPLIINLFFGGHSEPETPLEGGLFLASAMLCSITVNRLYYRYLHRHLRAWFTTGSKQSL